MKNKKLPFLKCCEGFYRGILGAGILFFLCVCLQDELSGMAVFPELPSVLVIVTEVTFTVQMLFIWSDEKAYRIFVGLSLVAANIAVGIFFVKYSEPLAEFWGYVGIEAVCIATSVIVFFIRRHPVTEGLLIIIQIALLVLLVFLGEPLPIWCTGMILTAFLFFLVSIRTGGRPETFGLLPFFAVAILVLCLTPKNEKPMDWSWVKKTYVSMQEKSGMLAVNVEYLLDAGRGFSFAGYGNTGKLGDSVFDSHSEQLHISGNSTKNPLYLTGKVYEVYTGSDWTNVSYQTDDAKEQVIEALEQSIYDGWQNDLTSPCQIIVEYRFIKTADLFHELHTQKVEGDIPKRREDFPWTMKSPQKKGFYYHLQFLEINENSEPMKKLYRQQAWKEDAVWDEEWSVQEEKIHETYTQLPENIPHRVYELADIVTKDAENDYDRMVALARYLKDYTYTKTPPACPKGQEFTDYFLFESKSGYCSHFATVLSVLGRCEGIPTRYVQGFTTSGTCKGTRCDLMLTGVQAHAWTEFYLEHIGWVRMDATPGYGERTADRWESLKTADGVQTGNTNAEQDALQKESETDVVSQQKPVEVPSQEKQDGRGVNKEPDLLKNLDERFDLTPYDIASLVLTVAFLTGMILPIRNIMHRHIYTGMDESGKLRVQFSRLLRLGKLYGIEISDGETLQEYQKRIQDKLSTKEYSFVQICMIYEGVRFGGREITSTQLRAIETYVRNVEQAYLADCSLYKKMVYRMFLF